MNDQLESRLRSCMSDGAAQVPAASVARVASAGYRPRTRDLRPPALLGTAALVAAGVVAAVSLSTGASNAFAGWSPTPSAPSPAQLNAAMANCTAHAPMAGLPLRVTDTRGPFTFSVYAAGNSSATCITGPSFTAVSNNEATVAPQAPPGQVLLSSAHLSTGSGQAYSFADGHTGAGVSAVTLILDDGTQVQATVANGWFVAWWPSAHQVKSADVATPAGVKTQTFKLSPQGPCGPGPGPGPCAGGGSGGATSGQAGGASSSFGSASGSGKGQGFSSVSTGGSGHASRTSTQTP